MHNEDSAHHDKKIATAVKRRLEFMMRRVGEVMSKAEILAGVWELDFDGDPNIVQVYIRRLRARIDEPFDRQAIETVGGGAGYRLVADGG